MYERHFGYMPALLVEIVINKPGTGIIPVSIESGWTVGAGIDLAFAGNDPGIPSKGAVFAGKVSSRIASPAAAKQFGPCIIILTGPFAGVIGRGDAPVLCKRIRNPQQANNDQCTE
jgi:hypothetical protein